jgi:hypothetical protein
MVIPVWGTASRGGSMNRMEVCFLQTNCCWGVPPLHIVKFWDMSAESVEISLKDVDGMWRMGYVYLGFTVPFEFANWLKVCYVIRCVNIYVLSVWLWVRWGTFPYHLQSQGIYERGCLCGTIFSEVGEPVVTWADVLVLVACEVGRGRSSVSDTRETLSLWVDVLEVGGQEAVAWAYVWPAFFGLGCNLQYLFHASVNDKCSSMLIFHIAVSCRYTGWYIALNGWAPELTHWTERWQMVSPWSSAPHFEQAMSDVHWVCMCPSFWHLKHHTGFSKYGFMVYLLFCTVTHSGITGHSKFENIVHVGTTFLCYIL